MYKNLLTSTLGTSWYKDIQTTFAQHTFALQEKMLYNLRARNILLNSRKWNRNKYTTTELFNKTTQQWKFEHNNAQKTMNKKSTVGR